MLNLLASLVFLSLSRLSSAQFNVYPTCVQPLLDASFPAACLSLSLAAQNTCLCQDADAFGNDLVTKVFQMCGCADLEQTSQLTAAYCAQVGIDTGPAFSVFIQDDTTCDGSTGGSTGSGTATSASVVSSATSTAAVVNSTPTSGSKSAGIGNNPSTPTAGSTITPAGGNTVTVTAGGASTVTTGAKSGANKGLMIEQVVGIVIAVVGGVVALQW